MKHFIGKFLSAAAASALIAVQLTALPAAAEDTVFDVRIVQTNDIHARIEENEKSGIIGAAKLKTVIDSFTEGGDMELVLDSGDLFHAQPIATLVQGSSVGEVMELCGLDCMTVGNHDFSYGTERLKELCSQWNIGMAAGNVLDENGQPLFENEFYTETAEKDGKELKIGIFGVFDPEIKDEIDPKLIEKVSFTDAAEYAEKAAAELRAQGCGIVIGLTHSYHPVKFAEKVGGVDLWLCGHEHILIDETVSDKDGKAVRVIESGSLLYDFSTIELSAAVGDDGSLSGLDISSRLLTYEDVRDVQPDAEVENAIARIKEEQKDILSKKVGSSPEELDGVWEHLRTGQTNLGKAVASSYILATGADAAFENAGGIRASVGKGDVTYGDIIGVSSYGNLVVTKHLTGSDLKSIAERNISLILDCRVADASGEYDSWPEQCGNVLQMAGIYAEFDPEAEEGSRITLMLVGNEPLDNDRVYTVAANNYIADSTYYPELAGAKKEAEFCACEEALINYFSQDESIIAADLEQLALREATADSSSDSSEDSSEGESEPEEDSKEESSSSEEGKGGTDANPPTGSAAAVLVIAVIGAAAVAVSRRE